MLIQNPSFAALSLFILLTCTTLTAAQIDTGPYAADMIYYWPYTDNPLPMLQAIDDYLSGSSYYGDWSSPTSQSPSQFKGNKGFVHIGFGSDDSSGDNTIFQDQFYLYFFDGPYIDNGFMRIGMSKNRVLPLANVTNGTVIYLDLPIVIRQPDAQMQQCITNMTIYFVDLAHGTPFNQTSPPDLDHFGVQVLIESTDSCKLQLSTSTTSINDPVIDSQLIPYIVILYLFAFIEAIACLNLYSTLKNRPLMVFDLCLGSLYFLTTHDLYIFLNHVYLSTSLGTRVTRPILQGIGIAYGIIVIFFNLPLLLEVKSKMLQLQWKDLNRKIAICSKIGLIFNIVSFVLAFESVILQERLAFYVVFALFPLPQIVQNFIVGRKFRWNSLYLGALVLPKILYFGYVEGYGRNLFRTTPDIHVIIGVLAAIAIQYIILLIQTKWPRFIFKVPEIYKITQVKKDNLQNCPICLEDFYVEEAKNDLESSLLPKESKLQYTIVTPCQHEFHLACLKNWVDHKFECPYCRQTLPLSYQLDEQFNNTPNLVL